MTDPLSLLLLMALGVMGAVVISDAQPLPGTKPLATEGDLAAQMVAGMGRFLMRETDASVGQRASHWQRDLSSPEAYIRSIEPNRQRFLKIIGAVDPREAVEMTRVEALLPSIPHAAMNRAPSPSGYTIQAVRWTVLKGVEGEGLLLLPDGEPVADVVALPDCGTTPEMLAGLTPGAPEAFARRLAEQGCRVLVPVLIDRKDTWSGTSSARMTNMPHREFVYRAAYEMGRHIIGYEVQKVLAAVDGFKGEGGDRPVGVIGHGEGGLIAFYAAASDTRIDAVGVSGYFQPREGLWREPIYRNVWSLLREFGDAEIAALIAPRALTVEACAHPEVSGPPPVTSERRGAAPGVLTTPPSEAVAREFARAQKLIAGLNPSPSWRLVKSGDGTGPPGSEGTLKAFLSALKVTGDLRPSSGPPSWGPLPDPEARHRRQFDQLVEHTQHLMRESEFVRATFWSKADASSLEKWQETARGYRDQLWETIGKLPPATLPASPRARQVYDTPKFRGYEVVLDVYPDVFAYGILLVPKDVKAGERRPVVVCQHGLEGRPQDVADPGVDSHYYHQFACKLAERGFVTYAPQNPYIGGDNFRDLQRKSNPLKCALFSFITRQHERTLEWLSSLPFVDPERIAFYGLSYGGKTAVRVPALLERYCLSICSADYNEWIWKNVSVRHRYSYMGTGEYDMPEFDLGNTFNYAEMTWLIFPRPFMVERGHHDGVAPDEWVAYEYARTFRRYNLLGLGDRTEIEFFDGPHTIHGVGTFKFLHRHLKWPEP
ncbi:MAG: hypothetical protein EXS64_09755 [Candidatus Latescibacteria bacterium]|nr:hypothetical protein [Candidatus Latescibacterota bacterium]